MITQQFSALSCCVKHLCYIKSSLHHNLVKFGSPLRALQSPMCACEGMKLGRSQHSLRVGFDKDLDAFVQVQMTACPDPVAFLAWHLSTQKQAYGVLLQTRKPYTITKARERWTDDEHTRFLEGMSLYGRSWGKVANHVQTKTTIQIRSHAQKYFNRIKKQQGMASARFACHASM